MQQGVEGVLKGSERPEAGCLGEYYSFCRLLLDRVSTRLISSTLQPHIIEVSAFNPE